MKPRALVVTNMWPTSSDPAFGVFVRDQVDSLRNQGADCDVFFIDGRADTRAYAAAIPKLRRRVASAVYDLVHAHYVLSGLAVWASSVARAGPPWLLTHHGIEVFEGWQGLLSRWLTGRADRALVQSKDMALRLRLPDSSILPIGVDLSLFVPGDRAEARSMLGLPSDRALVAWIGADRPEKRLGLAREAVRRLRQARADAELLVVTGIEHAQIPVWMAAADVLLVTSRREGGPVVVKEAVACNLPVVSTDVGDVADIISDLPGCTVVANDTAEELARGLLCALSARDIAIRAAVEPYDANLLARRLLDVYEAVADGPRTAPRLRSTRTDRG